MNRQGFCDGRYLPSLRYLLGYFREFTKADIMMFIIFLFWRFWRTATCAHKLLFGGLILIQLNLYLEWCAKFSWICGLEFVIVMWPRVFFLQIFNGCQYQFHPASIGIRHVGQWLFVRPRNLLRIQWPSYRILNMKTKFYWSTGLYRKCLNPLKFKERFLHIQ